MSNFTLPMTCVRERIGADRDEALGILRSLRGDQRLVAHTPLNSAPKRR